MGQRRVELTLRENYIFQATTENSEEHFAFGDGAQEDPTGRERKPEYVRGSGDREG